MTATTIDRAGEGINLLHEAAELFGLLDGDDRQAWLDRQDAAFFAETGMHAPGAAADVATTCSFDERAFAFGTWSRKKKAEFADKLRRLFAEVEAV